MKGTKENATILDVGAAACAVCCAGPIVGLLGAIGIGTAVGFALFGAVVVVIGAFLVTVVLLRRRRRVVECARVASRQPVRLFCSTRHMPSSSRPPTHGSMMR